jgi:hypothetical protein
VRQGTPGNSIKAGGIVQAATQDWCRHCEITCD